jgi:tRNA pseudouridine55 synthase
MILNINKPKDWTSFDAVAKIRGILRSRRGVRKIKIGHAGTLDPLATGVLIVLTDKDTKRQPEFMQMKKEYVAKIAFGATSKTYDLEGRLVLANDYTINSQTLAELTAKLDVILPKYIGEIAQTVPPYSAVKVNGKRLYKQARADKVAPEALPVKKVHIYGIDVLSFEVTKFTQSDLTCSLPALTCKISCGKGTYIRSLAHDLGKELGVGGVLIDLVRTKVGVYAIETAQELSQDASLELTESG